MDNKSVFASNLKRYMKMKAKSRNDISEALDISYFTVSDWVKGKKYPRMDKVEMLANYFGIQKSDLIEKKVTDNEEDNEVIENLIARIKTDEKFANNVKLLSELSLDRYESITQLLATLAK